VEFGEVLRSAFRLQGGTREVENSTFRSNSECKRQFELPIRLAWAKGSSGKPVKPMARNRNGSRYRINRTWRYYDPPPGHGTTLRRQKRRKRSGWHSWSTPGRLKKLPRQ